MTSTLVTKIKPSEYLRQHELSRHLQKLGITDSQLAGVQFRRMNVESEAFNDWTVICTAEEWPTELFLEQRAWCALRWLILEDPADSRNKRDAWYFLAAQLWELHRRSVLQANRGKKARHDRDFVKTEFVKAMQRAKRSPGTTLVQFLEAAFAGSIDDLRARLVRDEYQLEYTGISEFPASKLKKKVCYKTLQNWWSEVDR